VLCSKSLCALVCCAGRRVMDERGEAGPIQPGHIQEAYRRAVKAKKLPPLRLLACGVDRPS
jgi:hypothetical protein